MNYSERKSYKVKYQNWLPTIEWSHFVTVESCPSNPWKIDEIEQRMRQIEFNLNKKYLKSSFPKWKSENKFLMIGFKEGNGVIHQIHYHFLLHTPASVYQQIDNSDIRDDLLNEWMSMPSVNPRTGKCRDLMIKDKPTLDVRIVDDNTGASIYGSKWIDTLDGYDNFFFVTPSP